MTRLAPPPSSIRNAAQWLESLGNVPLERIVFDPPPGTATEDDVLRLERQPEKRLCELINGTLVEKVMGFNESEIAANLVLIVGAFIRKHKLGRFATADGMLRMSGGNIRIPDFSFIAAADLPSGAMPEEPVPALAPTLAAEVVSRGNTAEEIRDKIQEYFASGARRVWVLHPAARLLDDYASPTVVRTLRPDDTLEGGDVLPGFSVKVAELFEV